MHQERGVVATEAILSFALLLTTLLIFWSAVRLVYEKTSLETATQLSAQAGVTYFLRNTPISCGENDSVPGVPGSERCFEGREGAKNLVNVIFERNICDSDRSLGRETGDPLECIVDEPVQAIQCRLIGQDGLASDPSFEEANCQISSEEKEKAKALIIRFDVQGSIFADGGLLSAILPSDTFSAKAQAYGWRRLN